MESARGGNALGTRPSAKGGQGPWGRDYPRNWDGGACQPAPRFRGARRPCRRRSRSRARSVRLSNSTLTPRRGDTPPYLISRVITRPGTHADAEPDQDRAHNASDEEPQDKEPAADPCLAIYDLLQSVT